MSRKKKEPKKEKPPTLPHLELLREETPEERRQRPGYQYGLKHLVSANFKEFDKI